MDSVCHLHTGGILTLPLPRHRQCTEARVSARILNAEGSFDEQAEGSRRRQCSLAGSRNWRGGDVRRD